MVIKVKRIELCDNDKFRDRHIKMHLNNGAIVEARMNKHGGWEQSHGTIEEMQVTSSIVELFSEWLGGADLGSYSSGDAIAPTDYQVVDRMIGEMNLSSDIEVKEDSRQEGTLICTFFTDEGNEDVTELEVSDVLDLLEAKSETEDLSQWDDIKLLSVLEELTSD